MPRTQGCQELLPRLPDWTAPLYWTTIRGLLTLPEDPEAPTSPGQCSVC